MMSNSLFSASTVFNNSRRNVSVGTDEASPTMTYNDDDFHGSPLAATKTNTSPSRYGGAKAIGLARTASRFIEPTVSRVSYDPAVPMTPLPPKPYSKNFCQRGDQAIRKARILYLRMYFSGLLMVALTIFAVFSIYWGSLWKVPADPLEGWIVDFDGGNVGQTTVRDLMSGSGRTVKWEVVSSSRFPGGVPDVIHAVKENMAWVAVTINEGASLRLQVATAIPDQSYNGSQAITVYGAEARNENAYRVFIRPFVQTSLDAIEFNFAMQYVSQLSSSPDIANLLSTSPQIIVSPISYTIVNLIPFNQPVASAVVFVGLIYLLILSFFVVMVAYNARHVSGLEKMLHLRSLVSLRLISSCIGYFFLSLFYSLLNLAFQLDLTRKYGHAGFMIFWMLNWVGMLAVGLALESLVTLLTPQFIPFFMIVWVIANVSVCVFPIQVLPRIYHYGYATPFYNISSSTRSIAFGTKNTLGLNFGVLLAWVAVSCLTLPVIQFFVRRKETKAIEGTGTGTAGPTASGPPTSAPPTPAVNEKQKQEA